MVRGLMLHRMLHKRDLLTCIKMNMTLPVEDHAGDEATLKTA
jgi:hypothetical protein